MSEGLLKSSKFQPESYCSNTLLLFIKLEELIHFPAINSVQMMLVKS